MKRREYWRILSAIALAAACVCSWSSAQVYFPLHIGDNWSYEDRTSLFCEGGSVIYMIKSDTVIDGRRYVRPSLFTPYSGAVRADSVRVFEYDTTTRSEYVIFDFNAKPGDTLSIRDNGKRVMIALGSLKFEEGTITFTVRDSIGIVRIYDSQMSCDFKLTGAWINGQRITLGIPIGDPGLPKTPLLEQNYPNPFNPNTTIRYALPQRSHVTLTVYNTLGQQIATLVNESQGAGYHDVRFDGTGVASGVYYYRLTVGQSVHTRKMAVVK